MLAVKRQWLTNIFVLFFVPTINLQAVCDVIYCMCISVHLYMICVVFQNIKQAKALGSWVMVAVEDYLCFISTASEHAFKFISTMQCTHTHTVLNCRHINKTQFFLEENTGWGWGGGLLNFDQNNYKANTMVNHRKTSQRWCRSPSYASAMVNHIAVYHSVIKCGAGTIFSCRISHKPWNLCHCSLKPKFCHYLTKCH